MKLCRFSLTTDPGTVRSGIVFDNRIYETDGDKAAGIHEYANAGLLTPIGTPVSWRNFESGASMGQSHLSYSYANTARLLPHLSESAHRADVGALGIEARFCAVVQSTGYHEELSDVAALGYSLSLSLVDTNLLEEAHRLGAPDTPARDFGTWFGPTLSTPDELADFETDRAAGAYQFDALLRVNDEDVATVAWSGLAYMELVNSAAQPGAVLAGEVLAWPPFFPPSLEETELGRPLVSGDRVTLFAGPLGALTGFVA